MSCCQNRYSNSGLKFYRLAERLQASDELIGDFQLNASLVDPSNICNWLTQKTIHFEFDILLDKLLHFATAVAKLGPQFEIIA